MINILWLDNALTAAATSMLATATQRRNTQFFVPSQPIVQYERILRIQGYSDFSRVRPAILKSAKAMADLAPVLATPRVACTQVAVSSLDAWSLRLDSGVELECRAFASTLKDCTEIAIFVLSLGPALDARVVELTSTGDLLEALLLETTGWLCIEDATRQFKVHLRNAVAARQCRITSRMGPGYSYRIGNEMHTWPLEQQSRLFSAFSDPELPVKLTRSSAMFPKMSRSGLFGIAPIARKTRAAHATFEPAVLGAS